MIRNAFKMKLKPECIAEYKKRHDEIWPELVKAHSAAGISDYSIFFDEETLTLFAVQKLTDNHTVENLPNLGIIQKWWAFNAELMETGENTQPVCTALHEVFHMD